MTAESCCGPMVAQDMVARRWDELANEPLGKELTEVAPDGHTILDFLLQSVLPVAFVDDLSRDGLLPWARSPDDVVIVLSHDCDVTNASLAVEPSLEL